MKYLYVLLTAFILTSVQVAKAQDCKPLNAIDLRRMLTELGYEVKDISKVVDKEKFEIRVITPTLTVPIGLELSPSKNYIWLTVFLGKAFLETSTRNLGLLKRNAIIQPSQFYVTESGNLMMSLPLENDCVNNVLLRKSTDLLAKKVSDNKIYWQQ